MALWDIKGKALGVPVYELLGGPTRSKVRLYAHGSTPADIRKGIAAGFTAFKTGPAFRRKSPRYIESPAQVRHAAEQFADLRKAGGDDVDIAIDFHGKVSPALAKVFIKALEPHEPMFIEEPINCQNHDLMAEIARGTHLPIATGERSLHQMGLPRSAGKEGGHDLAAGPVPRGRHHRSASHRRHGRGVLRDHRAAQSARPDLAGRRHPAGRVDSRTSSARSIARSARAISSSRSSLAEGFVDVPDRARSGHRVGRECAGQARSAISGAIRKATTRTMAP